MGLAWAKENQSEKPTDCLESRHKAQELTHAN